MKALGALAVIIGCGLFGFIRAMGLTHHEKCVGAIIDSLRYMISELKAESLPLPELISALSENAAVEARPFFKQLHAAMRMLGEESFERLWIAAVMTDQSLTLTSNQRQILCAAGAFVGKFSVEEQAGALNSCIARLEPEHRLAAEKARDGKRLYPGLGLCAGLMLAAMFL